MPTGYTSEIYDNKPITFEDFVLWCARGTGACMHQRDDGRGPPKHRVADTSYYEDGLRKAKDVLEKAKTMTDADWTTLSDESYAKEVESWERCEATYAATRARYQAMRDKVAAWVPPTKNHEPFKKFMLDQIDESMKFDCSTREKPERWTVEKYREQRLMSYQRDEVYYERHIADELARVREVNQWIDDLYASLGLPVSS